MTKDLAGFDYADYFRWEWTGYKEPLTMDCARGFWICIPHRHFANTLPCLHVNETLRGDDYKNAERYIGGMIIEDVGEPAQKRMKAWVTLELIMSFVIQTSKRCETRDWPVSHWNRLLHEEGLIELTEDEISQMKVFEATVDKLSRTTPKGETAILERS